jgi:hypothetical protein
MTEPNGRWCPRCGARVLQIEKRPNGNSVCANGCKFPTSDSLTERPSMKIGQAVTIKKGATPLENMEGKEYIIEDVTEGGNCIIRGILFSPDQLERRND